MAEEKIKYQVIRSFGPSVFKVEIPKSIVDKLNSYIDNEPKSDELLKYLKEIF